MKNESEGNIDYIKEPVDAKNTTTDIKGMRTLFSAFHHFKPADAKSILRNAVKDSAPIAIFEGADKNILSFLGILLITPLIFIIFTPFMKPFKLSRIFFTYIVPLIPITTVWDGLVSIVRMYTPKEMQKMAMEVDSPGYKWKSGKLRGKAGNTVMYLTGYPAGGL